MSRLLIVLTLLFGVTLSASGAAAQDTATDVDIAAIGEVVLEADPDALAEGLQTPPDDADLPEGFINPPSGTPENAELAEALVLPVDDMEGAVASVNHAFDVEAGALPGLINAGYLNYVISEDEINGDDLDDFEEGAAGGLEGSAEGIEGTVDRIDIGGVEAVTITVVTEQEGVSAVVQMVAVPVGNTMVIGTALVADQGTVDPDEVQPFAEELTLAGASYLEVVAEDAQ